MNADTRPPLQHARRIDDIELLRAFAVLLVVLEHAHGNLIVWPDAIFDAFNRHFNGGAGVDLFFAISGFVIARDLLPRLAACHHRTTFIRTSVAFWIRRAWRILPSAWLWLGVVLGATLCFNRSGAFHSFDASVAGTLAAVLQFYNLHFAHCFMNYDCGANFVYWSLSLEEQFYLLFPVLMFCGRGRPRTIQAVLIVLVGLQLFSQRSLLWVMFRTDALLLGVLIAMLTARTDAHRPVSGGLALPLTLPECVRLPMTLLLLGIMAAVAAHDGALAPYRFSMVALIAALLVWRASFDRHDLMPPSAARRALLWVGSRSYAIYLIHVPAFYATREIWFRYMAPGTIFDAGWTLPFVVTAAMLTGLFAELNYRWVEVPLRQYGATLAARYVAQSPAAA